MLSVISTREFLKRKRGYGCNISSFYGRKNVRKNKYIKKAEKKKSDKVNELSQSDRAFLTSLGLTVLV